MIEFSFIDQDTKDFVRDHNGKTLIKKFSSQEDLDDFVIQGGLDDYVWANPGALDTYVWTKVPVK